MPKKSKTRKEQEGGAIPFRGAETLAEAFSRPEGEFEVKSSIRFYSYKILLTNNWIRTFGGLSRKSIQDVLANTIDMLAEANKTSNNLTIQQLVDMAKTQVERTPREAFATATAARATVATAPGQKRGRKSSTPPAGKPLSPDSEGMAGPSQPAIAVATAVSTKHKAKARKLPETLAPAAAPAAAAAPPSPPRMQSPPAMPVPRASPPPSRFEGQADALAHLMRTVVDLERGPSTKTERTLLKDLSAAQKRYEMAKAKEAAAVKKGVEKKKRAEKQDVSKAMKEFERLGINKMG